MAKLLWKRIRFTIKGLKEDLFGWAAWALIGLGAYKFADDPLRNLRVYFLTLSVFYFIQAFLRGRQKDFFYVPFTRLKDKANWMGGGEFEYVPTAEAFQITQSANGFIYIKSILWNNYRASIEFKLVNKCLGVIVRAVNLSNYLMFQISADRLRPHIKINGWWSFPDEISFENKISLDKWAKCIVTVENDLVNLKIYSDNTEILNRDWAIPKGSLFVDLSEGKTGLIKMPFPVDLDYGTVGFRNFGDERALVRDLLVEKI